MAAALVVFTLLTCVSVVETYKTTYIPKMPHARGSSLYLDEQQSTKKTKLKQKQNNATTKYSKSNSTQN